MHHFSTQNIKKKLAGRQQPILLKVENKILYVKGLDAINGTPVLDIKPVFKQFLPSEEIKQPHWVNEIMKNYWE